AFFLPGTASFILVTGLIFFLLNTIEHKNKIKLTLVASSVVISLTIIASFLGIFDKISFLPNFIKQSGFNPTGDYLTGAIFLISSISFAIFALIKESDLVKKLILALSLAFILIATGISVFTLVGPDKKNALILPPFQTSWEVAVDTIRENPILGIGPANYLTAFNRFRQVNYNSTDLWQIRFQQARNWYLNIVTEAGLFGLLGIGLLIIALINTFNKHLSIYKESRTLTIDPISFVTLAVVLTLLLVFPATPVTILLVFTLLSLNSSAKTFEISLPHNNTARLITGISILCAVFLLALVGRPIILAESKFKEANDALAANDGKKTYDLLVQSINLNPFEDRYHASFAQVNLAIARSIVSSVKDAKDLTDSQKNTILQLIQQAIKEGQNTVALNPTRAANWQVLANIYQVIIPYAKQADEFAIQAYTQTINLDPTDPNIRIALGGLYYSLGKYDDAISVLQLAVYAKPDLANSYYNLSAAYAGKNDFDNAIAAMNKVISLVPKDSNDYKTAQNDLENLKKKQKDLEGSKSNGETSLTAPKK